MNNRSYLPASPSPNLKVQTYQKTRPQAVPLSAVFVQAPVLLPACSLTLAVPSDTLCWGRCCLMGAWNHLKRKAWGALPYAQTFLPLLPVCHNHFAKAIPQQSKSRLICHWLQKEASGEEEEFFLSPCSPSPSEVPSPRCWHRHGGTASSSRAYCAAGCSRHGSSWLLSPTQKHLLLQKFRKHRTDSPELQGKHKFSIGNSLAVHTLLFTW